MEVLGILWLREAEMSQLREFQLFRQNRSTAFTEDGEVLYVNKTITE